MFDAPTFESEDGSRPKAVMVGVQLPGIATAELDSSLAELKRLAQALGLDVVGTVTQRRTGIASKNLVRDGKLHELARWTEGPGVVPVYEKPGTNRRDRDDEDDGEEVDEIAHEMMDAPAERATA